MNYRYLYGGRVQDFVLMRNLYRTHFITPPAKIGFSISNEDIRLNWKPPISLPFQGFLLIVFLMI